MQVALDDARRNVGRKRHEPRPAPRQVRRRLVRPPGGRGGRRHRPLLSRSRRQGGAYRRGIARHPRTRSGRPGGAGDDQHAGICRGAVRGLAWRFRGGPDQRQAASARIRLHPRRFGRRALHRDRGSGGRDRRHRRRASSPAGGRRAGRAGLCEALRRRAVPAGGSGAGRSGLAVLHLGHHGTPQGGDAQPPQFADHDARLLRRCRPSGREQHDLPRRADVARLGPLSPAAHRQGRVPGHPRKQGVQQRRIPRIAALPHRRHGVLRADHGDPAGQRARARLRRYLQPADHRLWRGADVRGGLPAGARCARPAAGPDLRPGRVADDHHRAVSRSSSRPRPSALHGPSGLGRDPADRCRGKGLRPRRRGFGGG